MLFRAPEPQVLDFMTQQYKLFTALAATYSLFFAQKSLAERYETIDREEMRKGDFKSLPEVRIITLSHLNAFKFQ